jgi:hypothetical protein
MQARECSDVGTAQSKQVSGNFRPIGKRHGFAAFVDCKTAGNTEKVEQADGQVS